MKQLLSPLVTGILLIGINLYLIPSPNATIDKDYYIYFLMLAVMLCYSIAVILNLKYLDVLVKVVLLSLSVFLVPMLLKGRDNALTNMIMSGMLGYLAYESVSNRHIFFYNLMLLCFFFLSYFAIHGTLEDVFFSVGSLVGRNYVGIYLFNLYVIYYALSLKSNHRPRHYPLFIIFITCLFAGGFSSSLTALFYLSALFFMGLSSKNKYRAILLFAFFITACYVFSGLFTHTELYNRITTEEIGTDRLILFSDLAEQMNLKSFFAGLEKNTQFHYHLSSDDTTNNLHNSYLNAFIQSGIFSLIYIFFFFHVIRSLFRINKMLGILLLGTAIRGITDGYYFTSFITDYMIFYFYFMSRDKNLLGRNTLLPPLPPNGPRPIIAGAS